MQDKNERGLVGDFFCGAGGASVGIEEFGVKVDFAVNHDQTAIRLHSRNHPSTYHMTEDIFTSEVERFVAGRKVSLIWASPDCTHFSKAKGKTPRKQGIRMLPYAVYFHAAQIHPEVICMENVAEIQGWCPIENREDVPGFGQPGALRHRLRCPNHKKALVCSDPKRPPCDTMAKTHQQQRWSWSSCVGTGILHS